MLIHHNPDDWVTQVIRHVCEYHKRQPWASWPGCTCSTSISSRRATPEERLQNIADRAAEEKRRAKHMADYDAGKLKDQP
jgi:hypothetical protein